MANVADIAIPTRRVMLWFMCCLSWCMAVILVYCLYIFSSIKKLVIYKKRYPNLVRLECFLALFCCILIWPMFANYAAKLPEWRDEQNSLDILTFILYPIFGQAIVNLEACRLWIMYFKINYMNAVSNNEWKSVIDNSAIQRNWYLNQVKTYGDIKWVAKRWFIWYLIGISISITIITLFRFCEWTQFIDVCIYSVPVNFIIFLMFKLLRNKALIHDHFFFYVEFKTTNIVYGTAFILYLSVQVLFFVNWYIAVQFTVFLCIFALSLVSVVSALFIPTLILNNSAWSKPASIKKSKSKSKSQIVHLHEILANKIYTEYFVQHINREFSVECILSYIEMKQFRYYIHSECNDLDSSEIVKNAIESFPDHIPRSTIIYHDDIALDTNDKEKCTQHYKKICIDIYQKYIGDDAEFQVNISWDLKQKYRSIESMYNLKTWNITNNELMDIFNPTIQSMEQLIRASLNRFKLTNDFKQIYKK